MKETYPKHLESLPTITKLRLPYWAKTVIAVSVGITPLVKELSPVIREILIIGFLIKLLGIL